MSDSEQTSVTQNDALGVRAVQVEYGVVLAAAVLMLTIPALAQRLLYGGIDTLPFTLVDAMFLFGTMGGFALLVGYIVHARDIGWARLGLRSWRPGLLEGLGLGAGMLLIASLWELGTQGEIPFGSGRTDFVQVALPILVTAYVLAFIANSVGEELLRAYVISRGEDMGWSTFFAALLSVLVFVSYHTYYAPEVLAGVLIDAGIVPTLYYVVRRNLVALITAHTLFNCVALWVLL